MFGSKFGPRLMVPEMGTRHVTKLPIGNKQEEILPQKEGEPLIIKTSQAYCLRNIGYGDFPVPCGLKNPHATILVATTISVFPNGETKVDRLLYTID